MNGGDIFFRDGCFAGRVAVITGAGGAICGSLARKLARLGASVAIWDISEKAAQETAADIGRNNGSALAVACDASDRSEVEKAAQRTLEVYGTVDMLVNGAGGTPKEATVSDTRSFFDLEADAVWSGFALNFMTALVPAQVVGRVFAQKGHGVILNIASIAGVRPLSRAIAYSSAKAAVINFTQWLAVAMAHDYSPAIRVNAIAPGFCLTGQNRFLLVEPGTGAPTARGRRILETVPVHRYGDPEEIAAAALWLLSDSASFVTGITVPVDGGFTAFSGV